MPASQGRTGKPIGRCEEEPVEVAGVRGYTGWL